MHNSKVSIIHGLIGERKIDKSKFIDDLEENLVGCEAVSNFLALQAKWGIRGSKKREDNSTLLLKELKKFAHGENVWV